MSDWIIPDWPAPPSVQALTTTRHGGESAGAHASFNLAGHVGDDPAAVTANRTRLRAQVPVPPLWLSQVHGVRCVCIDEADENIEADAGWTRRRERACVVMTADCLPVLLCNDAGTVVAAAHAGWRGLAAGVIEATVTAMAAPGAELLAWLGPAIGPSAFEVGDEVRAAFVDDDVAAAAAFAPGASGKWWCDLYALARLRLARAGVERVYGGGFCTASETDRFYSYRREGVTGRMASLIWLAA